jgi:acyl-CoA dehydrogenase
VLDQGERGTHESSMAKVICSEAIWRVVDRSMQILGGLGITDDSIVARLIPTSVRSASMTAPPRCIAGRSLGMCCGREGRRHDDY